MAVFNSTSLPGFYIGCGNLRCYYVFECLDCFRNQYETTGFCDNTEMERAISHARSIGLRPFSIRHLVYYA